MASGRIDNGVQPYDGTKARVVPRMTLCPQDGHIHEVPIYLWMDKSGKVGMALHGPQEPREIGIEAPGALPPKGTNPDTGAPRLPFHPDEFGVDHAWDVPFVHGFVLEWVALDGLIYHLEGGVRIHQVARKTVWYGKSWYSADSNGKGVGSGSYLGKNIELQFKFIFQQHIIRDEAGQQLTVAKVESQVAGGPSVLSVKWNGHPLYPKFPSISAKVDEMRYNPGAFAHLRDHINRQGMVVDTEGFHELQHALVDDQAWALTEDWNDYGSGDDLPFADEPAGIQHGH